MLLKGKVLKILGEGGCDKRTSESFRPRPGPDSETRKANKTECSQTELGIREQDDKTCIQKFVVFQCSGIDK